MKTKYLILILAVLAVAGAAGAILLWREAPEGTVAKIYQDGVCVQTIDLSTAPDDVFTLSGPAGENTIEIADGRIRVVSADCADQICVAHGWLDARADPIVCLPNRLVIRLEEAGGVDAVAK